MTLSLIVLQARLASRRLPGKALAPLGDRPILARCLDRLLMSAAGQVVLATTTNREDDGLVTVAWNRGVPVVRGPEADVLHRFVMAATRFGAAYVVRATADNPAVDIDAPRRVLERLVATRADYVIETGLPYGTCVEAVTTDALRKADTMASLPFDREHVTPFIRRSPLFASIEVPAPAEVCQPHLRLTVDSLGDLVYMRGVMAEFRERAAEPPLAAIIAAACALDTTAKAVAR
jgi:spore coat polysaccharide biosynthesis protein SpsF